MIKDKLPVVVVIGTDDFSLQTPIFAQFEEDRLDTRCYSSDENFEQILMHDNPHVVITIGNYGAYPNVAKSPFEIRKRWLHYPILPDLKDLGLYAYNCYLNNLFNPERGKEDNPLVSVFTPTYKTGAKIYRPFKSLLEQTYTNWEWICLDDSDDDGKTFKKLEELASKDHRIHPYRLPHSGVIGRVKNVACSLASGQILLELDHDDELTDFGIDYVVKGFKQFPEAGFLYTENSEIFDNGENATYGEGWGLGYGNYTDVTYRGHLYKSSACTINAKTIRHIVSAPNHIRAWRRDFYQSIGGHNKELHVADDYELCVRSFLKTRCVKVPKMCYIQYSSQSTQRVRNKDIQRHVRAVRVHYDRQIHDRLLELGAEDFAWDPAGWGDINKPNPPVESHVTLIANTEGW